MMRSATYDDVYDDNDAMPPHMMRYDVNNIIFACSLRVWRVICVDDVTSLRSAIIRRCCCYRLRFIAHA